VWGTKKLHASGTRELEWLGFAMAHTPLKMSIDEVHNEVRIGWSNSYSPEAIEKAVDRWVTASTSLSHASVSAEFISHKWGGSPG
jgi:hypothetical protein